MDALLTEAFERYEVRVAQVARLRDELARVEAERDHWREQIIERSAGRAPRSATPPLVKAPAKPVPKPRITAAPAPKAAPWTTALAKKLLGEIGGWSVVLREVAAAGGSVPVDKVPRADGDGVMGVASVGAFLSSVRAKARAAGVELPIASERARVVSLDPALCAVLREMGGVP